MRVYNFLLFILAGRSARAFHLEFLTHAHWDSMQRLPCSFRISSTCASALFPCTALASVHAHLEFQAFAHWAPLAGIACVCTSRILNTCALTVINLVGFSAHTQHLRGTSRIPAPRWAALRVSAWQYVPDAFWLHIMICLALDAPGIHNAYALVFSHTCWLSLVVRRLPMLIQNS